MMNSVSNVSFGTRYNAMDRVSPEQLNSYGSYSMADLAPIEPEHKKKGGFGKFLGKLILTAVFAGLALVGANRFIPAVKKAPKALEECGNIGQKALHYISKAGTWVEKTSVDLFAKAKNVFKKKEAAPAENPPAAAPTVNVEV